MFSLITLVFVIRIFSFNTNTFGAFAFQIPSSQLKQQKHIWKNTSQVQSNAPRTEFENTIDLKETNDEIISKESSKEEVESESFDWFKSWYPIAAIEFLDIEKPHKFKLLGIDIVIWNDGPLVDNKNNGSTFGPRMKKARKVDGNWNVFVDSCPHRKVPLSEGRIENDGSLLCSYHGWRFNSNGDTIDIPQISSSSEMDELRKIQLNPKSKCNKFPSKIIDGLLWVWPDASDDARIMSELADIPKLDLSDIDEERVWKGTWNFRELPYGHDFFMENVVDPAHVPVSHHNVVGSRYGDLSLSVKTMKPLTKDGFGIRVSNTPFKIDESVAEKPSTTFNAPSQVLIKQPFGEGGACQYIELYSSPSRPGFSNHVGRLVVIKDKNSQLPAALRQFKLPLPKWANHVLTSAFLNQDALFLHAQERALAHNKEYKSSEKCETNANYEKVILPISADKGVLTFRTWMKKFAGGYIPFKGDTSMPASSNDVVFDVWNAHTKHCSYCLKALKNLKRIRFASFLTSILLAAIRPKILGNGNVTPTIFALLFSGLGFGLSKLITMFYRYEFSHADNH